MSMIERHAYAKVLETHITHLEGIRAIILRVDKDASMCVSEAISKLNEAVNSLCKDNHDQQ